MLVAVEDQHRAVRRVDDLGQGLQLRIVDLHDLAFVRVDAAVRYLEELGHDGRRVQGRDVVVLDLEELVALHALVGLHLVRRELHRDHVVDPLGQLQVVGRAHADADVADLVLDLLLGVPEGHPLIDDVAVPRSRPEVSLPVGSQRQAQALALVQQVDLSPEIHQPVGARRAGEADDSAHGRHGLLQCPEALGLGVLEGAQLVDHDHVERPALP